MVVSVDKQIITNDDQGFLIESLSSFGVTNIGNTAVLIDGQIKLEPGGSFSTPPINDAIVKHRLRVKFENGTNKQLLVMQMKSIKSCS